MEAELFKQRKDAPQELKEGPPSANIRMALVKRRPDTCCHVNENMDNMEMSMLLDSDSEISLIHSEHSALSGKEMDAAGVKLVTTNDKPL